MKKLLCIFGLPLMMLAACSTADDELAAVPEMGGQDDDIEVNITALQGDIPIVIGTDGEMSLTRSVVNSDAFATDEIGVFCLARKGIDGTTNKGVVWDNSSTSATNNQLARWLSNAKAKVEYSNGGSHLAWVNSEGNIVESGQEEYFYPSEKAASKFAYSFAAYHPYVDPSSITYAVNCVYIHFAGLDGSQDVFTAVTDEPTDAQEGREGFSSAYFRDGGQQIPYFSFKHRMSKLAISIRLDDDYVDNGGEELWVDSVWITHLPDSMRVPLITYIKDESLAYAPDYLRVNCGTTGTYFLRAEGDKYLSKRVNDEHNQLTKEFQLIGNMLIPPIKSGTLYYYGTPVRAATTLNNWMTLNFHVRLKDILGNYYNYGAAIKPPTGGWEQAKEYPLNLKITPKGVNAFAMEADVELLEWELNTDGSYQEDYELGD